MNQSQPPRANHDTTAANAINAMSELLDLPPELIEHIFTELEAQVDQDPQETEETKIKAPLFRLTNRYIEQCTRRTFAATYFATRNIHISNDASIRRFCDMAQSSDLAESVVTLKLYVDNDRLPRQWGNSIDRDDFVDALYACLSIAELQFHNAPTDQAAEAQQEELDGDTVEAPTSPSVFDISSSFDYMLSLAEDADVRPLWLSTDGRPLCGLVDLWTFLKRSGAVCEVENLSLHIIPEEPRSGITPRDAYVFLNIPGDGSEFY